MANKSGTKWNKGGAMSRKNMISIDWSNFEEYAEKIEALEGDLKTVFSRAMQEAAEKVQQDTRAAIEAANLPAGGRYSSGDTKDSIITDLIPNWEGSVAEVGLGFDKTKKGAGGWLITGTPKMRPDYALEKIYGTKRYENEIKKTIEKALQRQIDALGL